MMDFRKILLGMSLLIAATFPVFVAAEDISGLINALEFVTDTDDKPESAKKNATSPLDFITGDASGLKALDYVAGLKTNSNSINNEENILDYVLATKDNRSSGNVAEALDMLVASVDTSPISVGALNAITGHYKSANYYSSGAWEATRYQTSSMHNALSRMMYASPQWGRITSPFGYRARFKRMHKGIDIAMSVGDTVRVPLPGAVDKISYEVGGYGLYVIIKHEGNLETRYAHLSKVLVSPGQPVNAQQSIALSGNSGNSTGPHLHFETRYAGTAVDPQTVFDFAGGMMMANNKSFGSGFQDRSIAGVLSHVNSKNVFTNASGINGGTSSLSGKSNYIVRQGDTLSSIASRAGITLLKLCQLNSLNTDSSIEPGTMLRLR